MALRSIAEFDSNGQSSRLAVGYQGSQQLRLFRRMKRLTQAELAELLEVHESTVGRWERGEWHPQPLHERRLRELGFQRLAGEDEEEMKRRQFLGGVAASVGLMMAGQDPFEPPSLRDLAEITRQYGSWFWRLSPAAIRPLLQEHQRKLLDALSRRSSSEQREIGSLAAQTTVMYGLTGIRQADPAVSEERFLAAARLAQLAGDRNAEVMAMIGQRSLTLGASPVEPRAHDGGYRLLEQAQRLTSPQSPAILRTWLDVCLAEDAGALGWELPAMRHLEDAERDFAQVQRDELVGYYDHWDVARLQGWRASTLLALGKPEQAAPILQLVTQETPAELFGPRSAVVADHADAYGRSGEVEQACSILGEAWSTAARGGDREMMTRTRRVRDRLAASSDSAALGQLAELMAAS